MPDEPRASARGSFASSVRSMRAGIVAVALIVAGGCSSAAEPNVTDATSATTTTSSLGTTLPGTEPSDSEPPEFEVSPADWQECADLADLDCATVEVPVDHADPGGPTVPIALVRRPARSADRIGSLVVNPGGPGASGREFLALAAIRIPTEVADRFDLVSFDPRGVGASGAIACDLDLDDRAVLIADDDRQAWNSGRADQEVWTSACRTEPAELADHLGTMDAARDLDLVRAAIGDDLLTYVGFSYGTRLGAAYAELFPDRVRAMVLDGAVAPTSDLASLDADQARGFDAALVTFATGCDADPDCPVRPLGPTLDVVAALRDQVSAAGSLPTDRPDRFLTPGEMEVGIISALYGRSAWPFLAQAIRSASLDGDGTLFQVLADLYLGRRADGTSTNQVVAGIFIGCSDDPGRPTDEELWPAVDAAADASEYFGPALRASFGCVGVPDPLDPVVFGPAVGAPPVLVIGTTGDPATPYAWAVRLTESFDRAVLFTVEGDGHTAYTTVDCVTEVVDAYLIDLLLPADGASCRAEQTDPFLPAGESEVERLVAFFACLADEGAEVEPISIADVLRDPTGTSILARVDFADPATIEAVADCRALLPA
jgi:pimeloyl-ACP methyl ester carboxylesterase